MIWTFRKPSLVSFLELPWDQPSDSCQEYCDWKEKKTYLNPWKKIDSAPLGNWVILIQSTDFLDNEA